MIAAAMVPEESSGQGQSPLITPPQRCAAVEQNHANQNAEIYGSSNGDKWFLRHDIEGDRVYVKHVGNSQSGGHQSDYEIHAFLNGPRAPERDALLRLIGSLAEEKIEAEVDTAKR